jgi:hypothetical protein
VCVCVCVCVEGPSSAQGGRERTLISWARDIPRHLSWRAFPPDSQPRSMRTSGPKDRRTRISWVMARAGPYPPLTANSGPLLIYYQVVAGANDDNPLAKEYPYYPCVIASLCNRYAGQFNKAPSRSRFDLSRYYQYKALGISLAFLFGRNYFGSGCFGYSENHKVIEIEWSAGILFPLPSFFFPSYPCFSLLLFIAHLANEAKLKRLP